MKAVKKKIFVLFIISLFIMTIATNVFAVTYEDDVLGIPQFVITYDESWTNGNILVHVSVASPKGNKIESVKLPNGAIVTSSSFNYTITDNGIYTFIATDDSGAMGYDSAVINIIDRETPALEMNPPTGWQQLEPLITVKEKK